MDHGVLNVPLAKRGDIDAQLDAYKRQAIAQQKSERKRKAAQFKADKETAKALLAQHEEAIVARYGAKLGQREVRKLLDSWVKWTPSKLIAFVAKFHAEAA